MNIHQDILAYNAAQATDDQPLCELLAKEITAGLSGAINKVWHAHPVWFLDDNPIVGYSRQKRGIRLMFWSGADFGEPDLNVVGKKFKDASIFYSAAADVHIGDLRRWLARSAEVQWDYKNIVRNKGKLVRLR